MNVSHILYYFKRDGEINILTACSFSVAIILKDIRCTYRFRRLFSQSENHPDTLAAPTRVPVPSKVTALDLLAVARHRNRLQQLASGITAAQGIAQTRSRGTI